MTRHATGCLVYKPILYRPDINEAANSHCAHSIQIARDTGMYRNHIYSDNMRGSGTRHPPNSYSVNATKRYQLESLYIYGHLIKGI